MVMNKIICLFMGSLLGLAYTPTVSGQSLPTDTALVDMAYGQKPTWAVTSAVSTIHGDDLLRSSAPSVGNALKGILPGLTVQQQSGEPGYDFYATNMYSRGVSSFVSGQKMLVFVDGFESTLDYLSAEEIESVSLLKDAAALALYGGRGANGVLLITTKKGMISRPHIGVRVQSGLQIPTFLDSPIGAYDYARLYNQAMVNDGLAPRYSDQDLSMYQSGASPYLYPNVDWKREMIKRSAPMNFAELSFRGGSKAIKYYVMAGMMQNYGLYKGTDSKRKENSNAYYARFNFRTNLDIQLTDALSAALYSGISINNLNGPGGDTSADKLISSIWSTAPNAFPVLNPNGTYGGNASQTNPVGNLLGRGLYSENARSLQVIFKLNYDFGRWVKGLGANVSIGYNNYEADTSSKTRDYARYALALKPGTVDDYTYTQFGADAPLTATEGFRTDYSRVNLKAQIDYDRSFGQHAIGAMAFVLSDLYKEYGVRDDNKYMNFGGRLSYSFRKIYIGEVSASYMGTDNFAPGHRFDLFSAVSGAWVMSNERFIQDISWIDLLKFRVSYGRVGNNQTKARFPFNATYDSKGSYLFGVTSSTSGGFRETILANEDATWEHKNIFNVGLNAILWHNLKINFDYFNEIQSGILTQPYSMLLGIVGASYGGVVPYMNIGKVNNHGFELQMRYDGKIGDEFKYFVEGSAWYAKNTVKERGEDLKAYNYLSQTGKSVWKPIVLIAERLYQKEDFDATGNLKQGLPVPQFGVVSPGDIKYVDQNDDKVINANDAYPSGYSTIPEWNYSLNMGLSWHGFDLSALWQGVEHRDVYLSGPSVYSFKDNGTASSLALNSWTETNTAASYPRLSTQYFDNNYRTSTFWRRNGSFLRLRNLQVGYHMSSSVIKALRLTQLYVYANATNVLTINHLDGMADPEAGSLVNYPLTKSFNIGIKLAL